MTLLIIHGTCIGKCHWMCSLLLLLLITEWQCVYWVWVLDWFLWLVQCCLVFNCSNWWFCLLLCILSWLLWDQEMFFINYLRVCCIFSQCVTPWYNHPGWLGIKKKPSYLFTQSVYQRLKEEINPKYQGCEAFADTHNYLYSANWVSK